MSESGEVDQVWTQNLKFEAKKGSQHQRRLRIVSFNLYLRASYPLPGSGAFLSIWREMKQRIAHSYLELTRVALEKVTMTHFTILATFASFKNNA